MADDVTTQSATLASVPSGGVYAADLISGVYYFRGKQTLGADGTNTGDWAGRTVDGGAGVAGYVDPRLTIVRIAVTPTVSTSPAYTAKDAVGGIMTFAGAARASAGAGILHAVTIVDKSQQRPDLDLILFDQTIAGTVTDNAEFDPNDTDLPNVVASIPMSSGTFADFHDNSVAHLGGLGIPYTCAATSLFGALVARSTPTFVATTDIVVTLTVQTI